MTWVQLLPENARMIITITGVSAHHTQYVRVGVEGQPVQHLHTRNSPLRIGPSNRIRRITIEPRSIGGSDNPSKYRFKTIKPGVEWRFECDDGPGGDSDWNDLYFTVEYQDNLKGYIRTVSGNICGRQDSRLLYYRNTHPSQPLRIHIDHYNVGRPDPHTRLARTLPASPFPDAPGPVMGDELMGCPKGPALGDEFRWDIVDVDIPKFVLG